MPWGAIVRPDEGSVVLQGSFIVADAYAASLVQVRDIAMMLVLVCIDDAVGREGRRAAIRMMNDDDILYSEQVLSGM